MRYTSLLSLFLWAGVGLAEVGDRHEIRDSTLALDLDHDPKYSPAGEAVEVPESHDGSLLLLPDHSVSNDIAADLQEELLTLDLLQAHAAEIEKEIKVTQRRIMDIWKADFAKCSGLKCYLRTALSKAPTFLHLIATHFSHHHHLDASFFNSSTHMNCTDEVERIVQQHEQQAALVSTSAEATAEGTNMSADEGTDESAAETGNRAPDIQAKEGGDVKDTTEISDHNRDSKPWWWHKRPGWRQHGPPWTRPKGNHRPYWARPDGRPPWMSHENPTPGAQPPSDSGLAAHHRPISFIFSNVSFATRFQLAFIITAASIISLCAISLALFLCLRRFRDPRRKADRAARREERMTRALYRKAACKYRWTTFWRRFIRLFTFSYWRGDATEKPNSGRSSTSRSNKNSEEKSSLIVRTSEFRQTGESSNTRDNTNIVTSQINNLRAAHSMVRQLMRAEEGRAPVDPTRGASSSPRPVSYAAARSTDTLPAYSLPPPSYHSRRSRRRSNSDPIDIDTRSLLESESEGDSDIISVVDGFTGYTPSTTNTGSSRIVRSSVGSASCSRNQSQRRAMTMMMTTTTTTSTRNPVDDAAETESSVVTCSPRLSLESERRF